MAPQDRSSVSKQSNLHPQLTPENVQQRRRRQQEMRTMVLNIQHDITKWTRGSFQASRSVAAEMVRQEPRRVTTTDIPCVDMGCSDSRIQPREPRTKHPVSLRHVAERGRGSSDIEKMGLISAESFLIVLVTVLLFIAFVYCDAVLASMMSSFCAANLICILAWLRVQRDCADWGVRSRSRRDDVHK